MARPTKKKGNGEGTIYKDAKTGKWRGFVTVGYKENGKQKRKSVTGNTKEEVYIKMAQIKNDIYTGAFIDTSDITVYQLGLQMLNDKLAMNRVKQSTYSRSIETLKRLKPLWNVRLQQANPLQINEFLISEIEKSQSTLNKDRILLNEIFSEALKRDIINKNPMEKVDKPKSKKQTRKIRALTVDEQKKLVEVLTGEDIKYSAQMLISLFTGMRMGEVNALQVQDVNLKSGRIDISNTVSSDNTNNGKAYINTTKTEAGARSIPLPESIKRLVLACIAFKKRDDLLFIRKDGRIITTNQVNSEFSRICKKYNIIDDTVKGDVTLHSLRHTYATRAIESGFNAKSLSKLMGHTDVSITLNTYADAFEQFERDNLEKQAEYMKSIGLDIIA